MSNQLIKTTELGKENVFPRTRILDLFDETSGLKLIDILKSFNMMFVPYLSNKAYTRNQISPELRRQGLWLTYVIDNTVYTEWYDEVAIDDTNWGSDSNWRQGSNALVGDLSISPNGTWVINGEDSGISVKGDKGDSPVIRIYDNKILISYDKGVTYEDLNNTPVYTKFRFNSLTNTYLASYDLGGTWQDISDEKVYHKFRYNSTTNTYLESTDFGKTWSNISAEKVYTKFRFNRSTNTYQVSTDLGLNWTDVSSDKVYYQFRYNGETNTHLVSTDFGATWTNVSEDKVFYLFRINDNRLLVSTDLGTTWENCSEPIAAWFRWADADGTGNVGKVLISRDLLNWEDLSPVMTNNLYIKGYVSTIGNLPSSADIGDIYMVGPTYDESDTTHDYPHYRMWVKQSSGWIDNGEYLSNVLISLTTGLETGITMSLKAITNIINAEQERAEAAEQANATAINTQKQKLSELEGEVETKVAINSINLIDENAISEKVVGFINPNTGTINTEITSYVISGFISVKPNTTYYGNKDVFRSLRCVAFYNDNELIPSDTQNVDSFTTPANCNRVRICTSVNNWDILSLTEGKAYSYVPFNPINGYLKDVDNTLETLTQEIQDSKEDVAKLHHIIDEGFVDEFELISGTFIERLYWEINKGHFSEGFSTLGIIYFTVPKYGKLKAIQNSDNPNIAYGFIGKVNDVSDIVSGGTVINVENYGDVGSEHIIEVSAGDIICIQTRYLAKNDENYKVYFCGNISLQEKIAELDSEVKPLISTYEKYNHDYVSTTWTNGLVNIKGETTSSPYYKYSNRISVNQGDIVWASKGGDLRCVCAYDANGSVVQAKGWFGNNETRFIVPSGIASVVVSIPEQMASGSSVVVSTKDVISDVKLPTEEEAYLLNQDILYGKKWAVFGDSFTEGQNVGVLTDGKYFGCNKSYPYIIANRHNMEIINYFLGGRTIVTPRQKDTSKEWAYNATRNYITLDQMYANVPSDVDYVTIYIGINDSHLITSKGSDGENYGTNVTADMGTIDSTDITTFYGAFNTVIQWFLTNRPFAHLGIIVSNGMDTDDFRLAEIEIAKKWGIPYIDLNGDDKTPMMHRSSNPVYSTPVKDLRKNAFSLNLASGNQHPNAMAYEFESTFIEAWMKTL